MNERNRVLRVSCALLFTLSGCGSDTDHTEQFTSGWQEPTQHLSPLCTEVHTTVSMNLPATPQSLPFNGDFVVPVRTAELVEAWPVGEPRPHVYVKSLEPKGDYPWLYHATVSPADEARVFAVSPPPWVKKWIVDTLYDLSPFLERIDDGRVQIRIRIRAVGRKPAKRQVLTAALTLWACEPGWDERPVYAHNASNRAPRRS